MFPAESVPPATGRYLTEPSLGRLCGLHDMFVLVGVVPLLRSTDKETRWTCGHALTSPKQPDSHSLTRSLSQQTWVQTYVLSLVLFWDGFHFRTIKSQSLTAVRDQGTQTVRAWGQSVRVLDKCICLFYSQVLGEGSLSWNVSQLGTDLNNRAADGMMSPWRQTLINLTRHRVTHVKILMWCLFSCFPLVPLVLLPLMIMVLCNVFNLHKSE